MEKVHLDQKNIFAHKTNHDPLSRRLEYSPVKMRRNHQDECLNENDFKL